MSDILPMCMMPDGADPCDGYHSAMARVAELESHNLEYALHEQKLQEAITRIDTLCREHPYGGVEIELAIKAAVELVEGE